MAHEIPFVDHTVDDRIYHFQAQNVCLTNNGPSHFGVAGPNRLFVVYDTARRIDIYDTNNVRKELDFDQSFPLFNNKIDQVIYCHSDFTPEYFGLVVHKELGKAVHIYTNFGRKFIELSSSVTGAENIARECALLRTDGVIYEQLTNFETNLFNRKSNNEAVFEKWEKRLNVIEFRNAQIANEVKYINACPSSANFLILLRNKALIYEPKICTLPKCQHVVVDFIMRKIINLPWEPDIGRICTNYLVVMSASHISLIRVRLDYVSLLYTSDKSKLKPVSTENDENKENKETDKKTNIEKDKEKKKKKLVVFPQLLDKNQQHDRHASSIYGPIRYNIACNFNIAMSRYNDYEYNLLYCHRFYDSSNPPKTSLRPLLTNDNYRARIQYNIKAKQMDLPLDVNAQTFGVEMVPFICKVKEPIRAIVLYIQWKNEVTCQLIDASNDHKRLTPISKVTLNPLSRIIGFSPSIHEDLVHILTEQNTLDAYVTHCIPLVASFHMEHCYSTKRVKRMFLIGSNQFMDTTTVVSNKTSVFLISNASNQRNTIYNLIRPSMQILQGDVLSKCYDIMSDIDDYQDDMLIRERLKRSIRKLPPAKTTELPKTRQIAKQDEQDKDELLAKNFENIKRKFGISLGLVSGNLFDIFKEKVINSNKDKSTTDKPSLWKEKYEQKRQTKCNHKDMAENEKDECINEEKSSTGKKILSQKFFNEEYNILKKYYNEDTKLNEIFESESSENFESDNDEEAEDADDESEEEYKNEESDKGEKSLPEGELLKIQNDHNYFVTMNVKNDKSLQEKTQTEKKNSDNVEDVNVFENISDASEDDVNIISDKFVQRLLVSGKNPLSGEEEITSKRQKVENFHLPGMEILLNQAFYDSLTNMKNMTPLFKKIAKHFGKLVYTQPDHDYTRGEKKLDKSDYPWSTTKEFVAAVENLINLSHREFSAAQQDSSDASQKDSCATKKRVFTAPQKNFLDSIKHLKTNCQFLNEAFGLIFDDTDKNFSKPISSKQSSNIKTKTDTLPPISQNESGLQSSSSERADKVYHDTSKNNSTVALYLHEDDTITLSLDVAISCALFLLCKKYETEMQDYIGKRDIWTGFVNAITKPEQTELEGVEVAIDENDRNFKTNTKGKMEKSESTRKEEFEENDSTKHDLIGDISKDESKKDGQNLQQQFEEAKNDFEMFRNALFNVLFGENETEKTNGSYRLYTTAAQDSKPNINTGINCDFEKFIKDYDLRKEEKVVIEKIFETINQTNDTEETCDTEEMKVENAVVKKDDLTINEEKLHFEIIKIKDDIIEKIEREEINVEKSPIEMELEIVDDEVKNTKKDDLEEGDINKIETEKASKEESEVELGVEIFEVDSKTKIETEKTETRMVVEINDVENDETKWVDTEENNTKENGETDKSKKSDDDVSHLDCAYEAPFWVQEKLYGFAPKLTPTADISSSTYKYKQEPLKTTNAAMKKCIKKATVLSEEQVEKFIGMKNYMMDPEQIAMIKLNIKKMEENKIRRLKEITIKMLIKKNEENTSTAKKMKKKTRKGKRKKKKAKINKKFSIKKLRKLPSLKAIRNSKKLFEETDDGKCNQADWDGAISVTDAGKEVKIQDYIDDDVVFTGESVEAKLGSWPYFDKLAKSQQQLYISLIQSVRYKIDRKFIKEIQELRDETKNECQEEVMLKRQRLLRQAIMLFNAEKNRIEQDISEQIFEAKSQMAKDVLNHIKGAEERWNGRINELLQQQEKDINHERNVIQAKYNLRYRNAVTNCKRSYEKIIAEKTSLLKAQWEKMIIFFVNIYRGQFEGKPIKKNAIAERNDQNMNAENSGKNEKIKNCENKQVCKKSKDSENNVENKTDNSKKNKKSGSSEKQKKDYTDKQGREKILLDNEVEIADGSMSSDGSDKVSSTSECPDPEELIDPRDFEINRDFYCDLNTKMISYLARLRQPFYYLYSLSEVSLLGQLNNVNDDQYKLAIKFKKQVEKMIEENFTNANNLIK